MQVTRNLPGNRLLALGLTVILTAPALSFADGLFVAPKSAWDKQETINAPSEKAILVYNAGQEDLILQVKYEGPLKQFGWLIPVPAMPTVQNGSMKCFHELSEYTQQHFAGPWQYDKAEHTSYGLYSNPTPADSEPTVSVLETNTVGTYDIAVLSTKDPRSLRQWLEQNEYYFPTNKADVLESYVKQQWFFVAVKINLDPAAAGSSASNQLSGGELNPLQISFASDHCVFPLKISSVNDKPSEVQLYVLSSEPLLEKSILDQKAPQIYSHGMAQAAREVQAAKHIQKMHTRTTVRPGEFNLPNEQKEAQAMTNLAQTLQVNPYDLLPFAKLTKADLADSAGSVPRLAEKDWWLTRQTWTFKPEEMRDLEFQPAIPVFVGQLDSKIGFFAAASLISLLPESVPAILDVFNSPDLEARHRVASELDNRSINLNDPRLLAAAPGLLNNSEPQVRRTGVQILTDRLNWNSNNVALLVPLLRDSDDSVRREVTSALVRSRNNLDKYLPDLQAMLKDPNPDVRVSSLRLLSRLRKPVAREDLLAFFKIPDREGLSLAFSALRKGTNGYDVSNDEAGDLLQNPEPIGKMIGLRVLYQNASAQSVELALPLLKDSDPMVRQRAGATLRAMTGQHFKDTQVEEWENWWRDHQANFQVQRHPEELRASSTRPAPSASPGPRPTPRLGPRQIPQ